MASDIPLDTTISYGPAGYKGLIQNPYIFALAFFASIGGVLFGYDQGVISGVLVMSNFAKTFPLLSSDAVLQGWMVSVLTLGAMFGALSNGPIADRYSRRWSLLIASVVFNIGSILQCAAYNIPMIFIGRFIAGLSVGMLSMVVPLYITELAPPNIRGGLVTLQQLSITIGIMIAFWLDYGTNYIGGTGEGQSSAAWRLPLALQCLPALILGVGTLALPYTPRWLMLKDREEEALATLSKVRRVPTSDWRLQREILEIKAATIFDKESLETRFPNERSKIRLALRQYLELFTVPHLRRRIVIACLLQIIQQLTGINAIIYYAPTIFKSIGLSANSVNLLATGVVGIINFFSTIPAMLFLDRWGRRPVLITGSIGMSIAQLIVGTLYAVYEHSWAEHPSAGWATAVFVWLYISQFAFSIGCVNWIMPSEILPPTVRSKGVGVAIASNWMFNFIVALITPRMLKSIRFGTFYFFLVFCLALLGWVFFFVPETRGVPIEEMDKLFGGNQGLEDLRKLQEIGQRIGLFTQAEGDLGKAKTKEEVEEKHVE
ncbi:sugar transporter [Xylariaceae sp. FL0662B]|nr:sugar transporter [Xylariaceae sp. FL0662B]